MAFKKSKAKNFLNFVGLKFFNFFNPQNNQFLFAGSSNSFTENSDSKTDETQVCEKEAVEVDAKEETSILEDPELKTDDDSEQQDLKPEAVLEKSDKQKIKEKILKEKDEKRKQKQAFKNLSKDQRKDLKERAKKVEKLNKPHKGEKNVSLNNPENIIELKNVVKYYSNGYIVTKILKGIDLEIKKGDFVIILGPSGSGKTTLMNIISGLDRASDGLTNVNGVDLINLNDRELTKFRQDNVGYVFQQYGLLPNLTVKENVEMGAELQKDKTKKKNVLEILESVGMADHLNKFPHQLSGGQQQRVSIARAFAKNPTILFGDEPTGAIDEEMSRMVLKEFVQINKNYKTTVIIVTHNPIFEGLGTLIVKIKDGQVHQLIRNENPKTVDELPWGQD